jgi:hypothetical protein
LCATYLHAPRDMRTRFIPASTADPTKSNCSGGVHYANSANAIGSTGAIWPRVNGSNYRCRLGGRYTQWSDHSHSVKALWGARCGKSARWVLSGGTGTRSYASLGEGTGSKGSDNSEAPQRATASRLVPTHHCFLRGAVLEDELLDLITAQSLIQHAGPMS